MFCVECGADETLTGILCKDCFLRKHPPVTFTPVAKVTVCSSCEAMARGVQWEDVGGQDAAVERTAVEGLSYHEMAVPAGVELEVVHHSKNRAKVQMTVTVEVGEGKLAVEGEVDVRVRYRSCTRCSRQAGNYFEAVLQIRGEEGPPTQEELDGIQSRLERLASQMSRGDRNIFIVRTEPVKGGRDLYLSNMNLGRVLAKAVLDGWGGTTNTSSTLTGRKDGRDMYRLTLLVRLPPYRRGDFIEFEKGLYRLSYVGPRKLRLIHMGEHTSRTLTPKSLRDRGYSMAGGEGSVLTGVVVSSGGGEAQIMHPGTFQTMDVRLPSGGLRGLEVSDGGELPFIIYRGNVYIVPVTGSEGGPVEEVPEHRIHGDRP